MARLASQLKVAHAVECHHRHLGIGLVTDSAWVEEGSSPALDDDRGTEQRLGMTIPHRIQMGHAGGGPVASQWVNARGWTERVGSMTLVTTMMLIVAWMAMGKMVLAWSRRHHGVKVVDGGRLSEASRRDVHAAVAP